MPNFGAPVRFNKIPVVDFSLATSSGDLLNPVIGQPYYNTTSNRLLYYNGSAFISPQDRAQHFGSQPSSSISDLAAVVQAYPLSSFGAPVANIPMAGYRFTGLADPVNPQDAATMNWTTNFVQSTSAGIAMKPPVVAVATGNVSTLSGLQTLDGVAGVAGARVLLPFQTTASQNGPWIMQTGAWTRPTDDGSTAELTPGALWLAETGGTLYGGSQWMLATNTAITPGTTAITINKYSIGQPYNGSSSILFNGATISTIVAPGGGLLQSASGMVIDPAVTMQVQAPQTITGNGSQTVFNLTHTILASGGGYKRFVVVTVYDSSGNKFEPDIQCVSAGNVTLTFGFAPSSSNTYTVIISG